jgi:polar amino acid transport system substrate-binding protein
MNTPKTNYFGLVLAIAFSFLLAGCTTDQSVEQLPPRLQQIKDSGQLIIGTALTAPFEFHDSQTGELKGLDVGLAKVLADKIGVPIVWKEMAFADLIPALQDGKMDMAIAGMYITDKRKNLVDMSDGYVNTGLVAVSQATTDSFATAQDLAERIVCVKTGSTGALYAQKLVDEGIALKIQEYTDTVSSLEDLSKGFCDTTLNDKINSIEYIKTHPDLKVASDILQAAQLGVAVRKGDAELLAFINSNIQTMTMSGDLEKLYNTWVLGN